MPGYRKGRITEDIRRELSDIIRSLKDPRLTGIISIVRVEVSNDLSYAKVFVSSIGGNNEELSKGLNSASGFIRHELAEKMHIRKTPELRFISDDSIEKSIHIAKLINEISSDEKEQGEGKKSE